MVLDSGAIADKLTSNPFGNIPSIDMSSLGPKLFWIIIGGTLIFILVKLMTHRLSVVVWERVKNGYVKVGGRFATAKDKTNGITYLRPMFGGRWLPFFPMKYFHKVNGAAFIGTQRQLNLIKLNEFSFAVIQPVMHNTDKARLIPQDTNAWFFIDEKRKFLAKQRTGQILYWLGLIAPSVIILAAVAFLIFAVYTAGNVEQAQIDEIKRIGDAILAKLTKPSA